jgi:cytochrome b subunit of formate dehydrogenase
VSPLERWTVRVSSIVVALTGLGFFWTKYVIEPDPSAFTVVGHPLEPWFLKIHVLSAPLFVFAVGLITVAHIARHLKLRVRPGRASGISTLATLGPMVVTGYLLQVVTSPVWLPVLAWTHIVSGVVFVVALSAHTAAARRAARACLRTVDRMAEAARRREATGTGETFSARIRTMRGRAVGGANPGTPDEAR